jgi:ligand-binding sensor domain-containing protein
MDQEEINQDWRWVHFTTASGLPSDGVQSIFEDTLGTVWVGTTSGLAWYDGFQWIAIDTTKGIPRDSTVSVYGNIDDSGDCMK